MRTCECPFKLCYWKPHDSVFICCAATSCILFAIHFLEFQNFLPYSMICMHIYWCLLRIKPIKFLIGWIQRLRIAAWLLRTAATSAAPRPDPSVESIRSNCSHRTARGHRHKAISQQRRGLRMAEKVLNSCSTWLPIFFSYKHFPPTTCMFCSPSTRPTSLFSVHSNIEYRSKEPLLCGAGAHTPWQISRCYTMETLPTDTS